MKTKRNSDTVWERKEVKEEGGGNDHTLAHTAAAAGDIPLLIRAVQQDPVVLQQGDTEGRTPLAHAVHAQHLLAVKRLVKMGADLNAQDCDGRTSLCIAAYQGWNEGVGYLLRKGANQALRDKSGRTPLHVSTYDTDSRSMCALLQRLTIEEMNTTDNEKMTALHWAAFHNRPDHVRHLLAKGANPLAKDVDSKTALHWAAQNGSRKCCAQLMEHVPELSLARCIDGAGKTPVHLAAAAGHVALLQDLAHGSSAVLAVHDLNNRTPLHWAAAMGHADCVKAMLQLGAATDPVDAEGGTPLDYAKQGRHKRCRQLLEERRPPADLHTDRQLSSITIKSSTSSKNPVGFLKGLFHKKQKLTATERSVINNGSQLPVVVVNGGTGKCTSRDNTMLEQLVTAGHTKERQKRHKPTTGRDCDVDSVHTLDTVDTRDTRATRETVDGAAEPGRLRKHKKQRRKDKQKLETDKDSYRPKSIRTQSSWNDENSHAGNSYQSVMKSVHLSPIGNTKAPAISPRLAEESSAMMHPEALALRRQGELSPLAEVRLPDAVRRINIAGLKTELDGASRSPTPPPYLQLNMHSKKALPGISPLATRKMTPDMADIHPVGLLQRPVDGRQFPRDVTPASVGNTRVPPLGSLHEEATPTDSANTGTDEPHGAYHNGHSRNLYRETSRAPPGDVIPLYNLRHTEHESSPDT